MSIYAFINYMHGILHFFAVVNFSTYLPLYFLLKLTNTLSSCFVVTLLISLMIRSIILITHYLCALASASRLSQCHASYRSFLYLGYRILIARFPFLGLVPVGRNCIYHLPQLPVVCDTYLVWHQTYSFLYGWHHYPLTSTNLLLGDRDICVWITCLKLLAESVTARSQIHNLSALTLLLHHHTTSCLLFFWKFIFN